MSAVEARADALAGPPAMGRPWRRALCWLAGLAPFFYLTYGLANWLAASRVRVPSIVFGWERAIPFIDWTIIPYWSINAFYGLSLFICATKEELDTHGRRLLTAQVIAVACFVLFPLRFTFTQPQTQGLAGFLFTALTSFDRPFNQAPSLHVALLVILWALYARHVPRWALWPLHLWFALVGISVLTTYQHHFIDVPTGALLGFACMWWWPERAESPLAHLRVTRDSRRRRLALRYGAGGAALAVPAFAFGGAWLVLLWPAISLTLVAASYASFGAAGFQKGPDGRMSLAAKALFAPYLAAAWVNSRVWTRRDRAAVPIADGVFLGRMPSRREVARYATVIDLSAELPSGKGTASWRALPTLDLVMPATALLRAAARAIEETRAAGPVLVCCALGFSRSAAAVATWLVSTGRVSDAGAAVSLVRRARPRVVLDADAVKAVAVAADRAA